MSKLSSREDGGGGGGGGSSGGGGGGLHGTKKAEDLDTEPTTETLQSLGFINSESRRREIAKVLDHQHPPRQVRVWAGGFLHSVCGLTRTQLEKLLREQADWATDGNRIRTEVRSLIQSSINNRRANESVNLDRYLGPGDMTGDTVESRKTESGDTSAGLHGGDSKMSSDSSDFDYTSKESVTVYKADSPTKADDGDRVIKAQVTNMNGRDEDGERVDTDFVTVSKGTLRDNGEFGVTPQFPQDNKSVGSANPDDLRLIAQALSEMADEIED
jgi:hypothetical protein